MGLASEFKEFAMKGNVVDMAVGVIIGAAFGKIVSSLVGDVIMPPLGNLLSGVNFSELAATVGTGKDGMPIQLHYGAFLQTLFDFVIIAFVLFMALKGINRLKKPAPNAPPPAPPRNEVLLEEIRDLLKKK
jgi:large conductance mechanosensitive channel